MAAQTASTVASRVTARGRCSSGLAMVATVVPGTVWTELAIDHSAVLLHVFDVDDEAAFVADFKARYEQPLKEIFE